MRNSSKELLKRLRGEFDADMPNLAVSVDRVGASAIELAGVIQSSFVEFVLLCLSPPEAFRRHSALGFFHADAAVFSRHALREALCGYYGAAGTLLRGAFEAVIRGAFWECLSHKGFRQTAEVLRSRTQKIEGKRRNILNWFDDIIEARPGVEAELEHASGAIFDKVGVLFKDKNLRRVLPSLRTMIDQLSAWKLFEEMSDPVGKLYDELYSSLSEQAHVIPDETLMGRRLIAGKDVAMFIDPSPDEFNAFLSSLTQTADVGMLVVLNLLQNDLHENPELIAKVAAKLADLEDSPLLNMARRTQSLRL